MAKKTTAKTTNKKVAVPAKKAKDDKVKAKKVVSAKKPIVAPTKKAKDDKVKTKKVVSAKKPIAAPAKKAKDTKLKTKKVTSEKKQDVVGAKKNTVVPAKKQISNDKREKKTKKVESTPKEYKKIELTKKVEKKKEMVKVSIPTSLDKMDKVNVWVLTEDTLFDIYKKGRKDELFSENEKHYMNIIHPVFHFMPVNLNETELIEKLKFQNYKIYPLQLNGVNNAIAIRRRPINSVMDLSYENIYHINSETLLRLIDENMGKGWKGLPLFLQDIIQAAFYVDYFEFPNMNSSYIKKVLNERLAEGYEILQIIRGAWIEAVLVKSKPRTDKPRFEVALDGKSAKRRGHRNLDDENEYNDEDIDDDIDEDVDEESDMEDDTYNESDYDEEDESVEVEIEDPDFDVEVVDDDEDM